MTAFDWITPTVAIVQDAMSGPNHTFYIPERRSGRSQKKVIRLLRKAGVKSWGHIADGGAYMLTVRLEQAPWAQRVLQAERIPVGNPYEAGLVKTGCAWVGWLVTVICIVVVVGLFLLYASMVGGL